MARDPYMLKFDEEEIIRLGHQHHIWGEYTYAHWRRAGFSLGHKILDLGCGPGS